MKLHKLEKYLRMTEQQVYTVAEKELSKLNYAMYTDTKNNFIFATPRNTSDTSPVLIVAHMDTVHKTPPKKVFFDEKQGVIWSPDGLGADDRAGVFAAIEIAKRQKVSVLLTTGEESGGRGAKAFVASYPTNVFGFKMALQLDRCGENDCVFYSNSAEDFHNYIQEFGFKKSYGSFSDISIIGPAWRINSANLSVGYISEHTKNEHLFVNHLINTINKVNKIISQEIPTFEYKELVYDYNRTYKSKSWNDKSGGKITRWVDDEDWGYYGNMTGTIDKYDSKTYDALTDEGLLDCMLCNNYVHESELVDTNNGSCLVCKDCLKDFGFECGYCGGLFIAELCDTVEATHLDICDDCYEHYYLRDLNQREVTKKSNKRLKKKS